MTDLEKLLAIEEIRTLFARRLRYMDTRQWHLYAGLHTGDAVADTYVHGKPVSGADAIAAAIEAFMVGRVPIASCHHGHTPEIEFEDDDTASGVWPMEDKLWWEVGERREWLRGYGHYHERYRRTPGGWRIAYRRLTRLRVDHSPGFYDQPGPPQGIPTRSP